MRANVRAAKTSRLVSSLSILGLILISILMVIVLNSSSLVNPTLPLQNGAPNGSPGPTGVLVVHLFTNQNESDRLSNPANSSFALGEKAMTVRDVANSSNPVLLVTDTRGGVLQDMAPGRYVLRLQDQTLNIKIPVQISVGNQTKVVVHIYGAAYPLVYSEESGILPTVGSARSNMFVELRSSTSVANASEPVLIKVRGAESGNGYLVNATVIARQPPTQGTQWLLLGTVTPIDPVNATSIFLTTWTYSDFITTGPIPLVISADA